MDIYPFFVKAMPLPDSFPGRLTLTTGLQKRYFTTMDVKTLGEDVLRQKALPVGEVTDEIRQLVRDMFQTMVDHDGVGLAAPQVGQPIRLFVLKSDDDIERVFINPQIIGTSQETCSYEEGCLSIPKAWEKVVRPERVTVQAINERGRRFTLEADGLLARIIQHENDHLDGILFIDRIDQAKKEKIEERFLKTNEEKANP